MSDSRKKNVFCMGSDKLAIVLDKIQSSGVKVNVCRGYWKESTCAFAYSPTYDDGRICYSSNRSFYEEKHNYVEVTPETFSELWLGYNCLKPDEHTKVTCKSDIDSYKIGIRKVTVSKLQIKL